MAQQGTYPLGTRTLASGDTLTGVVTGATADVSLAALADYLDGSDDLLKVVIIGDSMSAQNALAAMSITQVLQDRMSVMGVRCQFYGCNRDGHTYYRANTVAYIGAQTAVQSCIAIQPDVVIFLLGINDSLLNVDSRTLAQIKADADTAIAAVAAGVPAAKIVYVSQQPYDNGNFSSATCKNKGIPGYFHQLNTAGILTGYYSSEVLDNVVSAATQTGLAQWEAFDTYIKANVNVDLNFKLDLWKCARLGGTGNDLVHLNQGGVYLAAGYVLKGLRGLLPEFANLWSNNFDWWEDPDYVFSQLLTPSGDGYTYTGDVTSENQNILSGGFLRTNTWYLPVSAVLRVSTDVNSSGSSLFAWQIVGAKALSQVKVSVNGGAFANISGMLTDTNGNAFAIAAGSDTAGFSVGANTLRYAVDNICMDPKTVTYGLQTLPWVGLTLTNGWADTNVGLYGTARAYVDKYAVVHLRGVITPGVYAPAVAFTLPAGQRPPVTVFLTISAGTNCGFMQINTDGTAYITVGAGSVSLTGLNFPTV